MEQFNKEQVRKIWERVQQSNGTSVENPDLCGCAARELSTAALYRYLSRKISGRNGQMLAQFARQEQSHATAIKGICAVNYGACPPIRGETPKNASVPVLLRRCYGMKLQAISEYEKFSNHQGYGRIFRRIIQQEQEQLQFLLLLLGSQ